MRIITCMFSVDCNLHETVLVHTACLSNSSHPENCPVGHWT